MIESFSTELHHSVTHDATTPPPRLVPKSLERAAAWSWRLIVIGIVALAGLWLISEARVVFFPIVIAVFITRALSPVSGWLQRHRFRPALAAAVSMLAFFAVLGGALTLAGTEFADEAESIRPTVVQAIDDIEDWLVDDSPFNLSRTDVDSIRERVATEYDRFIRSSSDGDIADQATLAAEVFAGMLLAIILTFFMLKDGRKLADWVARRSTPDRSDRTRRSLDAAWGALAGYLRGASLLGILEATIIGLTLWFVGGGLIVPVMVLTVLGAFVPIVGATLAGVVAVLVALVTAGTREAVIVAIVILIVQQLDNDLLAPVIYGRELSLHPVAILISVVAGGALLGFAGTVLAVPMVAVVFNAVREYRKAASDADEDELEGIDPVLPTA